MCPYHSWSYDLTGKLRGTPEMDKTIDFNREDNELIPIKLDTWGGFIFITFDDNAPPGIELDRDEFVVLAVEVDSLVHLGRAAELAGEIIAPAVIGAHDQLAVALPFQQLGAAVPAGVGEGPNFVVLIA